MQDIVRLKVKVVPGASRPGVAGWLGDALKIRVAAPRRRGAPTRRCSNCLVRSSLFMRAPCALSRAVPRKTR